ncbi:MAG: hypothetical protein ACR2L8_01000, partial [Solirubrobacteraceae bacterium]
MRRLMQRASIVDAETEMSLRIIDRFDRLVAERVDVGALSAHAAEITGRAVLAASVEQAAGRSGVVWAHHEYGRDWSIADQIAVERLALAVSARALEEHERASARQQQRVALEV